MEKINNLELTSNNSEEIPEKPKENLDNSLEKENIKIWKTIEIVNNSTKEEVVGDIKSSESKTRKLGILTRYVLDSEFSITPEKKILNLALISLEDLGFKSEATIEEAIERSSLKGLELCPVDVPLTLFSSDEELSLFHKEGIIFASEPIVCEKPIVSGNYNFSIRRLGEGHIYDPVVSNVLDVEKTDHAIPVSTKLVFVIPQ